MDTKIAVAKTSASYCTMNKQPKMEECSNCCTGVGECPGTRQVRTEFDITSEIAIDGCSYKVKNRPSAAGFDFL
jgi:hypothetical protein